MIHDQAFSLGEENIIFAFFVTPSSPSMFMDPFVTTPNPFRGATILSGYQNSCLRS